ncbi:hypothetical protein [Paenibacillus sp. Z6-24]
MQGALKITLLIIIITSLICFFWFITGATAYFQRGMDIIGTAYLWYVGLPLLLFSTLLVLILIKRWNPTSKLDYIGLSISLIITLLISIALVNSVKNYGWINKKIESDSVKITADQKYEYHIDLVNLFQKNSSAELYLKDLKTGEVTHIPVNIKTNEIIGLGVKKTNHWVKLEVTKNDNIYLLYTTKELGIPQEKFMVNVSTKSSSIISQ